LVVGKVLATDVNAGQKLSYRIVSGNAGTAFRIDAAKGVIMVNNASYIKARSQKYFDLVIMSTDSGGKNIYNRIVKLSSTAVIRIYTKN